MATANERGSIMQENTNTEATAAAVRASVERGDWQGLPTLAEAQAKREAEAQRA